MSAAHYTTATVCLNKLTAIRMYILAALAFCPNARCTQPGAAWHFSASEEYAGGEQHRASKQRNAYFKRVAQNLASGEESDMQFMGFFNREKRF